MSQSLHDIGLLAEALGKKYLDKGKVNLDKIAKQIGIEFVHGSYENHFLGQLIHKDNNYYIVLNDDLLSKCEKGRVRFTIAHEYGHYFIEEHKDKLSKGISLSFNKKLPESVSRGFDIEANHFASHLLMPQTLFLKQAKKSEPGMQTILNLKSKFDTSIESTSKHYVNLNLTSSILIKWYPNGSCQYCTYSKSFSVFSGIRWRLPLKYNLEYVKEQLKAAETMNLGYIEQAAQISHWVPIIRAGSPKDCTGLEQTIRLGEYGGITLLTFTK